MTALEEIKKALKKVYIAEWYISGVKTNGLSVVHNAADSSMFGITAETFEAEYLVAANPAAISELLSTLESLQRENEELRKGNNHIAAEKAGIAKNAHNNVDYWKSQYEAAEAEVKRLREALKPFAEIDPINVYENEDEDANGRYVLTENQFRAACQALTSSGGEHHAE